MLQCTEIIKISLASLLLAGCAAPERDYHTKEIDNHPWTQWAECVKHTMEFKKCHELYIGERND